MKKFIDTLRNIWKIEELRKRILFTLGILLVYRIGSFIVLPGVIPSVLENSTSSNASDLLGLINVFTGGAFNNAAIFDENGPTKSKCGKYELTFMVNVVAPFIITKKVLSDLTPKRIIITSSISHTDCAHHLNKLDYQNLQFEKGGWSAFDSYGLSKQLVIMMSRGFRYSGLLKDDMTLINMDPGTVNTKMLLAGWGACGIDVDQATDTYCLATEDRFVNQKIEGQSDGVPKYYCSLNERQPTPLARDSEACKEFWSYMDKICKQ